MPTFTAIALDRLLEPGAAREKSTTKFAHVKNTKEVTFRPEKRNGSIDGNTTKQVVQKKPHWTRMSPALYTTPEATPVPDAPSSFPPSPYIINHKRRGASLAKRSSKGIGNEASQVQNRVNNSSSVDVKTEMSTVEKDVLVPGVDTHPLLNKNADEFVDEKVEGPEVSNKFVDGIDSQSTARVGESYNFLAHRDSLSCSSYSDGEDNLVLESSVKFASSAGEFYDAPEELSSDSSTSLPWQAPPRDFELELREMKLALFVEIEQRKQADDALQHLRCQWLKLREQLSSVGISLPANFPLHPEADLGSGLNVCEQINVARYVSEAVGRGIAKAEAEKEMEVQLELKNFEISRLNDRLHYYEAVNQEMSQRNQEVMELARQLRQRRNRRQRWVWGSIATAITLGTAALACTYLPTDQAMFFSNYQELPKDSDNSGN